MGTYTQGIARHHFDTSSGEVLAKDLSEKLRINVRHVFQSDFNDSMKLYHKPISDDEVYFVIHEYVYHESAPWFDLEEYDYFKRYVLEKYGEEKVLLTFYHWCENDEEKRTYLKKFLSEPACYSLGIKEGCECNELDYNITLFDNYLTIGYIIEKKWWDLVDSLMFTGIGYYNYFEEDREDIKKLCLRLGIKDIYLTADNDHGVGIPENRYYTWEEAEKLLRNEAGERFIDISKIAANEIIYLPLDNDREYPKLLYDNFVEIDNGERFTLGEKMLFETFIAGYNDAVSSLRAALFDDYPKLEVALQRKKELEKSMQKVLALSSERAYINTLYAFVHYWNNDLETVNELQTTFLKESLIYKNGSAPKYKTGFNNFNVVETYLYLIFSSGKLSFIEQLTKDYPFVPEYFYICYKDYLKYTAYEKASIPQRIALKYEESRIDEYYRKYWQPIYGLSVNEKLLQALINKQYSPERINKYISEGGDVNYFSKKGYNALTKVIENYWSRYLPLYPTIAEMEKQYEHVKLLLDLGVDVNFVDKEGFNSLWYAYKSLNYKVFEILLQRGININFIQQMKNTVLTSINQELNLAKSGKSPTSIYPYLNEMKIMTLNYGGKE